MNIEQVKSDNLKREYNITVAGGDIESAVDKRLKRMSKRVKIAGFRPGKVPLNIVKSKYKKDVLGEVLDDMLRDSSQEALKKEELRPAMTPKIEITEFEEGKDLKYKMEFEILPEVPEVDFSKVRIEQYDIDVGDDEVEAGIKRIAEGHKHFHPIKGNRAAKKGDAVIIDFKGFIDGEPFTGGSAEGHQLELGSNTFIAGFEEQLIGKKAGDEVVVESTFPDDYHAEHLAGKDVKFEVAITEIREVEKHEKIDDEFAKHLGLKDLKALQDTIRKQIEHEAENSVRSLMKKQLFDELDKECKYDLPEQMVEAELEAILQQIRGVAEEEGEEPDDKTRAECQNMAERRVRLGILLAEIGRRNDIKVTQEEFNNALMAEARNYPGQETKVLEFYKNNPQHLENFRGPLLEEKVVNFILDKAKIDKKSLTLEELREKEKELMENEEDSGENKKESSKSDKPKKSSAKKPSAKKATDKKESSPKKAGGKQKTSQQEMDV